MDRLRALAVFRSVVEHGGFSRAAAALDLSCSVVTRTVQELEDLLGVRLLLRTTRSVSLTSVGKSVLEHAIHVLAAYEHLEAMSSRSAREPQGLVRVAALAALGRVHLGAALAAFRSRFPEVCVELRLREDGDDGGVPDADVILCLESQLRQAHVARKLASLEVAWFASRQFLEAQGCPSAPKDLERFDCLVHWTARHTGWVFVHRHSSCRQQVLVPGVLHSNHEDVLMSAAVEGAGVVQLPLFMAGPLVSQGRLCRVLEDWQGDPHSLYLSYESRRHLPLAVGKLVEHLVHWFASAAPVTKQDEQGRLACEGFSGRRSSGELARSGDASNSPSPDGGSRAASDSGLRAAC
jgi:DNA-binding transcriptional LysR family regulator